MSDLKERVIQRLQEEEAIEEEYSVALVKEYLPILQQLGPLSKLNQYKARELLDTKLGPMGLLVMANLALNAKSEGVKASCAKDLAYMGGFKPIERSQSQVMNVSLMQEGELDSMIVSLMKEVSEKRKLLKKEEE